jgi:non-canonical (house-cleaning) NTP pyrophosphatase
VNRATFLAKNQHLSASSTAAGAAGNQQAKKVDECDQQERPPDNLHEGEGREGSLGDHVFVGLESGVLLIGGAVMDFCACAISFRRAHNVDQALNRRHPGDLRDREREGESFVGISSAFPLPPAVADAFLKVGGPQHGQYNEAFAVNGDTTNGTGSGVLGSLTGGRFGRPEQMTSAVMMALMQFTNATQFPYSPFHQVQAPASQAPVEP